MALHHEGFPIRKSADISLICSSPQLIAACHVLLRLLMPRHSPYALVRLNFLQKIFSSAVSRSLNCLSFFVHFRFAVKKLSLFHRFVFRLVFADRSALHSSKLYLLPYFVERPIFSQYLSSISVRFYSFTLFGFQ